MRILMLAMQATWSPQARGEGAAVARLATALGATEEVVVAAGGSSGRPSAAQIAAVDLPPRVPGEDLLGTTLQGNNAMLAAAARQQAAVPFDLVHAHDWHVVWAAAAIKDAFGVPIVSTVRRVPEASDRIAWQATWWLTFASRRTIVPNARVRARLESAFGLPHGKQTVVGPGRGTWTTVARKTREAYRVALEEEDHALWPSSRRDAASLRALWNATPS